MVTPAKPYSIHQAFTAFVSKHKKKNSRFINAMTKASQDRRLEVRDSGHRQQEKEALKLVKKGKLIEAEVIYRELISLGDASHATYANLAAILGMQRRIDEAIVLLSKAIELKPDFLEAYINIGIAFKETGDINAAIKSYEQAIQLQPSCPEAYNNLGIALREQGKIVESIAACEQALALRFAYPDAHNSLGLALQLKGELEASICSYNKAIALKPDYPSALCNLGTSLQMKGDLVGAISSYRKALSFEPKLHQAHLNLGVALKEKGDLAGAIKSFGKVFLVKPDDIDAHWNASLAMLLDGDYKNGLEKYEWRLKKNDEMIKPHATPHCRMWNGKPLQQNSQLLLVSEQGLGDTLQFMRYAITLRKQGIIVSLCAQTKLHPLIKTSGIDACPLTPEQAHQVKADNWIPLLSVPYYLGVNQSNPIICEPYIKSSSELLLKWKSILSTEKKPVVGINWQGNRETEKVGLRGRSLPLELFSPILNSIDLSLLSLQKGFGSEQLTSCSFRNQFVSCQNQINEAWDFLETAAIVANCDLIITSDTAVAHLAGGMGKPTWLLLHQVPDWRWGLSGDTSFWYPSMRLFRQRERGNWIEVMERIAVELQNEFLGYELTHLQ